MEEEYRFDLNLSPLTGKDLETAILTNALILQGVRAVIEAIETVAAAITDEDIDSEA